MNTLTYNMPNDIHTYVLSCPSNLLDLHMKLLFENGAYKVTLDTKVELTSMKDYEVFKNE